MNTSSIVQKLWNYCNVLRDDGMSYGDYVEAAPAHPCARGIRTSCSAQLTYLLFLKMADERTRQLLLRCSRPLLSARLYLLHPCSRTFRHPWRSQAPYNQKNPVPEKYSWPSLIKKDGDELFDHYRHSLEALGNEKGLLGLTFTKSQNKFDSNHPWSSACSRAARARF